MPEETTPNPLGTKRVNWTGLGGELVDVIRDGITPFLEQAEGDINGFASDLAGFAVEAQRSGNEAAMEEIKANMPWLAEFYRVKAVNAQWEAIGRVLDIAKRAAGAGLSAVVTAIA